MFSFDELILLFIIASSSSFHPQISAQEDKYQDCLPSFSCGNISEIGYPFWTSSRHSYCGHPSFQLYCRDQTANFISASELKYQVLSINDSSRIVSLARVDYLQTICTTYLHNNTFDSRLLGYFSDTVFVELYYNCGSALSASSFQGVSSLIQCSINSSTVTSYFVNDEVVNEQQSMKQAIYGVLDMCSNKVLAPADRSAAENLNSLGMTEKQLIDVLSQGFRMVWDANNTDDSCSTCRESGGSCGFDSNKFACFCSSGQADLRCENSHKSKNTSTAIGVSVAVGFLILISLASWLIIIRKRKKLAHKQTLSRELLSTSIHPTKSLDPEIGSTFYGVLLFTSTELSQATNNFDSTKELGSGGYGTVYHGVLSDGREVAVKRLFDSSMKRAEQFMNEIEILNKLTHKNLVMLYGCTSRRSKDLTLVFEYVPNKTVAYHLAHSFLSWKVRLSIAKETADALAYLHSFNVIHRDVKTANLLLDDEFRVKVADFGLSRLFPNDASHVSTLPQGTLGYVDPDYFNTYQVTDRSDVYSFGVVLVELLSSLPAVDTERERDDVNLGFMALNRVKCGMIGDLVDPELGFERNGDVRRMATLVAELAFRCLQPDKEMRPSMAEAYGELKEIERADGDVVELGAL